MDRVVSSQGGGGQYPPIPGIRWDGGKHNLAEISAFLGTYYPEALEQASRDVGQAMPKSARGLIGRVEANIARRGFPERLALQGTTEEQITEAVSDTKDFLAGKIKSLPSIDRPDLDKLGEYWNTTLELAESQMDPPERSKEMAKAVLETWRDIRVFVAMPKAQRILDQRHFEHGVDLPELKRPDRK